MIKPPAILQILPQMETGGVEQSALDVTRALKAAGFRALIACEGGRLADKARQLGGELFVLPMASKNPWTMWRNAARLESLCHAQGVDLVHARSRAPAYSARRAARRLGLPFVTTIHGAYNASSNIKRRYNSIMATGDRVIANSHFIMDYAAREFGLNPPRLVAIPRGIDMASFDLTRVSAERMAAQARAWRLMDGYPVIMLPGRLTRWKGQAVLIAATKRLVETLGHRHVQVLLVGDAQGRDGYVRELEQMIRAHGLEGVVRMPGPARDMGAAYALSDIIVSASTDPEAFGRVSVEGQAMARLVIATDHGGSRETIHNGETGWLVPPGDDMALAEALGRALMLGSAARLAMGAAARRHVMTHYDLSLMTERTLAVYRELLNGRR